MKNKNFYRHNRLLRSTIRALPFLLPSLLGICVFYLLPLIDTLRASVMNSMHTRFVGLVNYQAVLQNEAFQLALANTSRFLGVCIPLLLIVSLFCALVLRMMGGYAPICKTILLLPYAIPVASMIVLWRVLFASHGLMSHLLVSLGGEPIDFLHSGASFWVLIITYLWRNNGYDMILWLAGLEAIPLPMYEAASVDGASSVQIFRYVTLPNLLPTACLVAILSIVNSFRAFREAWLLAGNYPHNDMYLLQHLFHNWFLSLDIGKLSAAAILLVLALTGIIAALVRIWGGRKA